ncbi:MAG: hypothetical protein M3Y19_00510, partial [Actinomycetota bacterium]|nr:hypothetical protein [Actinomycetota bacterium]
MTLSLPAEVSEAASLALGGHWPQVDEDALTSAGEAYGDTASRVKTSAGDADRHTQNVLAVSKGGLAQGLSAAADRLFGTENSHVANTAQHCTSLSTALTADAGAVRQTKVLIVTELCALTEKLAALRTAGNVTGGATLPAITQAIAASSAAIEGHYQALVQLLHGAVAATTNTTTAMLGGVPGLPSSGALGIRRPEGTATQPEGSAVQLAGLPLTEQLSALAQLPPVEAKAAVEQLSTAEQRALLPVLTQVPGALSSAPTMVDAILAPAADLATPLTGPGVATAVGPSGSHGAMAYPLLARLGPGVVSSAHPVPPTSDPAPILPPALHPPSAPAPQLPSVTPAPPSAEQPAPQGPPPLSDNRPVDPTARTGGGVTQLGVGSVQAEAWSAQPRPWSAQTGAGATYPEVEATQTGAQTTTPGTQPVTPGAWSTPPDQPAQVVPQWATPPNAAPGGLPSTAAAAPLTASVDAAAPTSVATPAVASLTAALPPSVGVAPWANAQAPNALLPPQAPMPGSPSAPGPVSGAAPTAGPGAPQPGAPPSASGAPPPVAGRPLLIPGPRQVAPPGESGALSPPEDSVTSSANSVSAQPSPALALVVGLPLGVSPRPSLRPARQLPLPRPYVEPRPGLCCPVADHPEHALLPDPVHLAPPAAERSRPAAGTALSDSALLEGYAPLGGMRERELERRFVVRGPTESRRGEYAWPPCEVHPEGAADSYLRTPQILPPGIELDLLGSARGRVLAAARTPLAQRSVPAEYAELTLSGLRVQAPLPVWQ